jgi:hypothetical protein
MTRQKKGMTEGLQMLPKIVLILFVVGFIIALAFQLQTEQRSETRDDLIDYYNSTGMNLTDAETAADASDALEAVDESADGMTKVSSKIGLIVTIIIGVLLISIILIYLWPLIQQRLG